MASTTTAVEQKTGEVVKRARLAPSAAGKMKAVAIASYGPSTNMQLAEVDAPKCGDNDVLVDVAYAGVNFIDTYHRTGLYAVPALPFVLGREASGVVAAVGKNATGVRVGDRVAFMTSNCYAEKVAVPFDKIVPVPKGMDMREAAAALLQGLTAHYLTCSSYPIQKGDWVLIHAGAGGTGALAIQIAKIRGATVVTTVSSAEKAAIARAAGADHVINYAETKFEDEVKRLTNGQGVHAVYDGVGKTTFMSSLVSVRRRGHLVLFGNSSGAVPPFDPLLLSKHGSLYVSRPTLVDFIATPQELQARCGELFGWIASGQLKLRIDHVFPLEEAFAAHDTLESRKALGKILLQVNDPDAGAEAEAAKSQ